MGPGAPLGAEQPQRSPDVLACVNAACGCVARLAEVPMHRAVLFVSLIVAALVALIATAVPAQAGPTVAPAALPSQAACPHATWGSLPKVSGPDRPDEAITGVRVGSHPCFARLVVQTDGTVAPGFDVRYVPQIIEDGSGRVLSVPGAAKLQVIIHAQGHNAAGNRTFVLPRVGGATFKGLVLAGDFEGQTTLGLGVRARLPFRVFQLTGPPRVVIDVARHW